MRVTNKPVCRSEAYANRRAMCNVCGGADGDGLVRTVDADGIVTSLQYCPACFPACAGQEVA